MLIRGQVLHSQLCGRAHLDGGALAVKKLGVINHAYELLGINGLLVSEFVLIEERNGSFLANRVFLDIQLEFHFLKISVIFLNF